MWGLLSLPLRIGLAARGWTGGAPGRDIAGEVLGVRYSLPLMEQLLYQTVELLDCFRHG